MRNDITMKHPMRRLLSNRRGLLAGAAAVTAGLLTRLGERVAQASSLAVDSNNTTPALFAANSGSGRAIAAVNGQSTIYGDLPGVAASFLSIVANGVAISAGATQGIATGIDSQGSFYGVKAYVLSEGPGPFVATGVWGSGKDATGVAGTSTTRSGVFGISGAAGPGLGPSFGVHGTSVDNIGTFGSSTNNIGVYGLSTNNYGVQGVTGKSGYAGLVGVGSAAGSAGFYALGVNGATAGTFQGNVVINGSLTVTGTYPKSAAVKKKDGTLARMYCVEAPESWFEDFGTANLANGQASVALDPEFDEVVNGNDYRVFLTEIGDCGGLFVSRKGPHRFEVRSRAGTSAGGSFDYRVVARRLDNVGQRMEKVEIPTMAPIDVGKLTRPQSPRGGER